MLTDSFINDYELSQNGNSNGGECIKINWDNSNKNEFEISAKMETAFYPPYMRKAKLFPAFVNCSIKGYVALIKDRTIIATQDKEELYPNTTHPIKVPPNMLSFKLNLTLDQKKYEITSETSNDKFSLSYENGMFILEIF